jgi:hypothetical protein
MNLFERNGHTGPQKQASRKPQTKLDPDEIVLRASRLLDSLGPDHLKELTAFCASQLGLACSLSGPARELFLTDGADLLHDAFESLLVGLQNPNKGHHPNANDVQNLDKFLCYLRKVVRDLRIKHAALAALRAEIIAPPLVGVDPQVPARTNPAQEVELSDLKQEFFKNMHSQPARSEKYAAALETWREDFFLIDRLTLLGLNSMDTCTLQLNARWLYLTLSEPEASALGTSQSIVRRASELRSSGRAPEVPIRSRGGAHKPR